MHRKQFLTAAGAIALGGALPGAAGSASKPADSGWQTPPNLKSGSLIGITSPAGYISVEEIQPALKLMQSWGFRVRVGSTIGKRDFSFGGTDTERASDLQAMLDDHEVHAIMCARGGYGSVRIIDKLDWTSFRQRPKWIIGFSDLTVIHAHLSGKIGIASIHSKMCNSFPDDWSKADPIQVDTILSIRDALTGAKLFYPITPHPRNRTGTAEGYVVGGNLKTIESLAGSASDLDTHNRILFLEDTGEYLYSIDRMFWNLERSGKLSGLKALVIGGFKLKSDDAGEEFGRDLYQIVHDRVAKYRYPVCFDFPVGHQKNNFAIKCGVRHRLDVQNDKVTLKEINA